MKFTLTCCSRWRADIRLRVHPKDTAPRQRRLWRPQGRTFGKTNARGKREENVSRNHAADPQTQSSRVRIKERNTHITSQGEGVAMIVTSWWALRVGSRNALLNVANVQTSLTGIRLERLSEFSDLFPKYLWHPRSPTDDLCKHRRAKSFYPSDDVIITPTNPICSCHRKSIYLQSKVSEKGLIFKIKYHEFFLN